MATSSSAMRRTTVSIRVAGTDSMPYSEDVGGVYTSCIRINGEPILPPLVTTESRPQLRNYREQAVVVERRLARRHSARLPSTPSTARDSGVLLSSCSDSGPFNLPSSDGGDGYEAICENMLDYEEGLSFAPPSLDSDRTDVTVRGGPSGDAARTGARPRSGLSFCLLDVAEFSREGLQVLHHHGSVAGTCAPSADLQMGRDAMLTTSPTEAAADGRPIDPPHHDLTVSEEGASPRLVRSGSYTLEAPSPVLLAHLERQSRGVLQKLESCSAQAALSANSNNSVYVSASDNSSYDDDYLDSVFAAGSDTHNDYLIDQVSENFTIVCKASDDAVVSGAQTTDDDTHKVQYSGEDATSAERYNSTMDKLQEPQHVLAPPSSQLALYNKQCVQVTELSTEITDLERTRGADVGRRSADTDWQGLLEGGGEQLQLIESLLRDSAQQRAVAPPPGVTYCRVIELLSGVGGAERAVPPPAVLGPRDLHPQQRAEEDGEERRRRRQERAASVIGAGARGYLTRRLMHTEKVQSLIQTIHDAVVCAVQLHEVTQLEEADVELHRRLIQQVSAACYAFHDVFFALSVPEQMAIIAGDRKRRLDRARKTLISSQLA